MFCNLVSSGEKERMMMAYVNTPEFFNRVKGDDFL